MATLSVTCTACRHVLGVKRGVSAAWLTCPRCLNQVRNPWQQVTGTPAPARAPGGEFTNLPGYPQQAPRCPNCGRDVEASWRFCPGCNADLRGGQQARTTEVEVDVDVKRDTRGSALGLGGMAALGVLGVVLFVCGGELNFGVFLTSQLLVLAALVGIIIVGVSALSSGARSAVKAGLWVFVILICGVCAGVLFLAVLCSRDWYQLIHGH